MKNNVLYTVSALLAISIISCKSKEDKRDQKILEVLPKVILDDSLAFKIDSIKIVKVDTLTELKDSLSKISVLNRWYQTEKNLADIESSTSKNLQSSMQLSLSQARLYRMLNSNVLVDSELESAKRYKDEAIEANNKATEHLERANLINKRILKIADLHEKKKLDSVNFKGYWVLFKVIGADKKNGFVKLDSLFVMLTPEYHIIKNSDVNRK